MPPLFFSVKWPLWFLSVLCQAWELAFIEKPVGANQVNQWALPNSSAGHHSRVSLFMCSQSKACDGGLEPGSSLSVLLSIYAIFTSDNLGSPHPPALQNNLTDRYLRKYLPNSNSFDVVPEWQEILWAAWISQDRNIFCCFWIWNFLENFVQRSQVKKCSWNAKTPMWGSSWERLKITVQKKLCV